MTRIASLWAAIVTGVLSTFVIPAAAWAQEAGVGEELRKAPKIGGFLCFLPCLLFIVAVVVVIYIVMQKRKR